MSKADDTRKEAKRKAVIARLRELEGSRLDMLAGMLSEQTLDALILAFGLGSVQLSEWPAMTVSTHMPLLERLRKGANCVGFLDGAPEPAADAADIMTKAADEIERLQASIKSKDDALRAYDRMLERNAKGR